MSKTLRISLISIIIVAAITALSVIILFHNSDSKNAPQIENQSQITQEEFHEFFKNSEYVLKYSERGGLCSDGPCGFTLPFYNDGSWDFVRAAHPDDPSMIDRGEISVGAMNKLFEAIQNTKLDTVEKISDNCPSFADGTGTVVDWSTGSDYRSFDNCGLSENSNISEDPIIEFSQMILEEADLS